MPRFILLVQASPSTEGQSAGPGNAILTAVARFNDEMNAAGILLGGEGLRPTSHDGHRLTWTKGSPTVTKGPFDLSARATVSGWWIIRTKDADEALEWAKKIPFTEGMVELRRISEPEDFGADFTPEMRAHEDELRAELDKRASS